MFECHACFRRHVRTLFSIISHNSSNNSFSVEQNTRRAFRSTFLWNLRGHAQRVYAHNYGEVSRPAWRSTHEESDLQGSSSTVRRKTSAPDVPDWDRYSEQKSHAKRALLKPRRPGEPQSEVKSRRLTPGNITTELKYLKDPLKLSDHVRYVLEQGDGEKALALVRMSNANLANTVSWNHLIDWQMKNGRIKAALDTYNDMKKRGQKPDSHTYTLILRGFADNVARNVHFHNLGKALSVYHSMSAPNSKVAPSIIHTNAMLKVCARANDMDSIWDIASKLPERGPHAANSWTFTTILNGMRIHALISAPNHEAIDAAARRREETIIQARQLWGPIKTRWRQGDLMLDEELVCAMGRLLLIGARPRDWDDVLSLIQQAMNIPRMIPRLGTAGREEFNVPRIRAPDTPRDMKNDASEIVDEYDDPRPGAEFDAFDPETPRTVGGSGVPSTHLQSRHNPYPHRGGAAAERGPAGYAQPGRNTLSLILEACLKMASKQPGLDYWNLLTNPTSYAIVPDSDNLHMLLRLLRHSRSSAEATELLCDEFPRLRVPQVAKSFRIAMSTCVRDSNNPAALDEHAVRILDLMQRVLPDPDPKTLGMFVGLAKDADDVPRLSRALDRIDAAVGALRSRVSFQERMTDAEREECLAVFRGVVGCYDKVLSMDAANKEVEEAGGRGVSSGSSNSNHKRPLSNPSTSPSASAFASASAHLLPPRTRSLYIERSKSLAAFIQRRSELARKERQNRAPAVARRKPGTYGGKRTKAGNEVDRDGEGDQRDGDARGRWDERDR